MPNTTLIESFLRQMYGDSQGFAILTTITPPIEPDDDPVVIDTPFEYPTQTAEMAAAASESAPGADVYYCTSLRSKSRRRREFSSPVGAVWIHADVDDGIDRLSSTFEELDAYVVGSGSPGHGHVYVRVDEPLSEHHFTQLCAGLRDHLRDADVDVDNKIASNDILRVPGPPNHKTDPPTDVVVIREWEGHEYDADDLADKFGVVLTDESQVLQTSDIAPEPVEMTEYVRAAVNTPDPDGDRSRHASKVINAAITAGYTKEQTLWCTLQSTELHERYRQKRTTCVDEIHRLFGNSTVVQGRNDWDLLTNDIAPVSTVVTSAEQKHVRWASEMAPARRQEWLAEKRIPKGKVTLLVGVEGIGKSAWWVWCVAKLTTGTPAPEFGITSTTPLQIALVITEDSWSMDVLPRLTAAGADLSRIRVVSDTDDGEGSPMFPTNLDWLPEDVDLVIVDAWLDTVPANLSVKDSQQARRVLHPMKEWCGRTGVSILLVTHLNRLQTGNVRDAYGSTGELRKAARSTLLAQREQGTDDVLLVGTDKSNGARVGVASKFQTFGVALEIDGEDADIVSVRYIGQANASAAQIFQDTHDAGDDKGESKDCVTWLREFLTVGNGSAEANVVKAAARAELYSDRALGNAKRTLRVKSMNAPLVDNGPWLWVLPDS